MIENLKQLVADRVNEGIDNIDTWVHRKEFQALPNILQQHEKVTGVAEGTHQGKQGMLFTTDKRFLFVRKPLIGAAKHTDFNYHEVANMQVDYYTATAVITLDMPDGRHTLDHIATQHINSLLEGVKHSNLAHFLS